MDLILTRILLQDSLEQYRPVVTVERFEHFASEDDAGEQTGGKITGRIEDRSSVQSECQAAAGDQQACEGEWRLVEVQPSIGSV